MGERHDLRERPWIRAELYESVHSRRQPSQQRVVIRGDRPRGGPFRFESVEGDKEVLEVARPYVVVNSVCQCGETGAGLAERE